MLEAAGLLGLRSERARAWLDGYERAGVRYPPVIRRDPTGSDVVTWGEFVELGYLREYRRSGVPLQRLRPVIDELRREFDTPYPLATPSTFCEPLTLGALGAPLPRPALWCKTSVALRDRFGGATGERCQGRGRSAGGVECRAEDWCVKGVGVGSRSWRGPLSAPMQTPRVVGGHASDGTHPAAPTRRTTPRASRSTFRAHADERT